jgi:diguanylate cyclase (GGDEF)-like protein
MSVVEKGLRVLLVEDSDDDTELLLCELAKLQRWVVHERVDSETGLRAALERQEWDIVVSDHNLPTLDAPAVLRVLQQLGKSIPFIIVSGVISDEEAVSLMENGAADLVRKSHLSLLAPAIQRQLERAAAHADLKRAREAVHRIAHYDQLTGLPNRESLFKSLEELISGTHSGRLALLLLNLNRFRHITSTLGIAAGNRVLQVVAERLSGSVAGKGLVARLGGDKFAILLPGIGGMAEVEALIAELHSSCHVAIDVDGRQLFMTCSLGISLFPDHAITPHHLVINAETAMYQAKAAGKCHHRYFEQEMSSAGEESLLLEHALYRALGQDEFRLHYQPQFDLESGRIIGVEALLRWQHPEFGLISPAKFIPLLEETGLIVPVGEWVLRTACAQNRAWQQAGMPPIRVAVNLSAIQFQQPGLVKVVEQALASTRLDPRWLELEITENIAMHQEEAIIETLSRLRKVGISLAIDDFGTGYSSLSYLKRFPIDKLKIDQSFVRDISRGASDGAIVKAVIAMACGLGVRVIAEGVETGEQAAFLRSHGCHEAQGYLFARPMPAGELERTLVGGSVLVA